MIKDFITVFMMDEHKRVLLVLSRHIHVYILRPIYSKRIDQDKIAGY